MHPAYAPVDVCHEPRTDETWMIWSHAWRPRAAGTYGITLAVDDPSIATRHPDAGFYQRTVDITAI